MGTYPFDSKLSDLAGFDNQSSQSFRFFNELIRHFFNFASGTSRTSYRIYFVAPLPDPAFKAPQKALTKKGPVCH